MDNLEYNQIDHLKGSKRKKAEIALRRLRFAASLKEQGDARNAVKSVMPYAGDEHFNSLDESSIIAFAGEGVALLQPVPEPR